MRLYTVYYISVNCCACFGCYLHPSSGAHVTLITASCTGKTFSATFRYRGGVGTPTAPDDGWRYHPKHVEQFTEIY